jgi:peptidoglycan/LPS O-acetylase OafA/YrhL
MTNDRNVPGPDVRETLAHPRYRADIDGLRAIAVLSVVGFHAFPEWVRGGFVGVDVFFVISGFLISGIIIDSLAKGTFSFAEFYARRIRRIFPALIVVLMACWGIGWVYLLPADFKQLGKHIAGGAGFVSNFVLWNESGYFDKAAAAKPLLHLWSLGIEEQFYIAMPLLLYLAWRGRVRLILATLMLAAVSFLLNVGLIRGDVIGVFYSPLTRIWELLLGSVLAGLMLGNEAGSFGRLQVLGGTRWRNIGSLAGMLLIAVSALLMHKQQLFPGWLALLPTIGACLLIAAGPAAWLNRRVLANPLAVWFGLISYPLYLWHWPLLSFATIISRGGPLPLSARLAVVSLGVALAWLTYLLVEKPIRRGVRFRRGKTVLLCLAMAAIAGAGLTAWRGDGFASRFRFDRAIMKLTSPDEALSEAWHVQIRQGQCHMEWENTNFGDCIERNRRPLVFLWGDSYAASLYPGLKALQNMEMFGIAQFTANSCPPLLGFDNPGGAGRKNCPEVNQIVMANVRSSMPDVVLLHANWETQKYGLYDSETGKFDSTKLSQTVRQLQTAGIRRIVLIGPVPTWKSFLYSLLFEYYRWDDPRHQLPPPRLDAVGKGLKDIDTTMRRLADEMHIEFISAAEVFCNAEGCLTRFGDSYSSLTTLDAGHLSPIASQYLIERIAGKLLPPGSGQALR